MRSRLYPGADKRFLFLWCLFLTLSLTRDAWAQRIVFQNARVHGSFSNAVAIDPAKTVSLVVKEGRIESIGSSAVSGKVDQKIDLKGAHLFPGIIALNTSLGLSEISGVRSTRDLSEVGEYTPDVQSWIAVNPDSELLAVARANGITYIQPTPQGGVVAGQSGLVALAGWTMEQMAIQKPLALHVYWPDADLDTTPKDKLNDPAKWKSLEDQAKERQKKLKELEEFFADARAYAKAKGATNQTLKNPAWEAMLPYLAGDLPIMIHADDLRQIKAAVKWVENNQLKVIIAGGRDAWMIAKDLAAKKIPVLYEHTFTQPVRASDRYDVHYKAPAELQKAGVPYAIGMGATAFDAALIKNVPYQAAQSIGFGLPREEALKAITLYPAQLIGMSHRIGSIDVGKEATFFAADGDILDIRTQVQRVWISGKEVTLDNRHTRLYEKYQSRPKSE